MNTHIRSFLLCVAGLWLGGSAEVAAQARPAADPDDLLIVDCLLPGQVRRLGIRSTYVSAREPVRTTARECRIRGGEYVSHDRADYQTSLEVWLPAAREGDGEAQVNVGTIFERGLGRPPDFAAAAEWYTLAAEDGHVAAQLKLAHFYEVGLGVPRDSRQSMHWYRQALGPSEADIEVEPARSNFRPGRALDVLEDELAGLRQQNRELRALLEAAEARTGEDRKQQAPLRARLAEMQRQLTARTREIDELQSRYEQARERFAEAAGERDGALARLEQLREEHGDRDAEHRSALEMQAATISELQERLQQKEDELRTQQESLGTLYTRMGELEVNLETAAAQREAMEDAVEDRLLSGPSLTMIDPRLPGTRGLVRVTAPPSGRQQLVGRVDAPAGLLSLTVNQRTLEPNPSGVFLTELAVRGVTPVTVRAIDAQGKRTDLSFELSSPSSGSQPLPAAPPEPREHPDLGRYHALVIGNDAYRHLPRLKTAVQDARAMSAVLEQRYGFDVRLLVNADRYAVLSALNEYRERLTPDDNLLIYYAGHGELDEVNMRGHWLPVDAEAENTANWISNVAVTDVLNVMRAKHVMVIADSCYSGSLTRSSVASIAAGRTEAEERNWIRAMSRKRARLVLSSGGLAPVLDAGGGVHSVFASALLDVLESNAVLLDSRELYREVAARVAYAAANLQFEQVPEFGPIRHAGDEAGTFFLLPH